MKYCSLVVFFNSSGSIRVQSSGTHIPGRRDNKTNVRGREICHRQDEKARVMHWAFGNLKEQRTETRNSTTCTCGTQTCLSNMWSRLGWRGRQARSELSHRSVELGDAIHRMQDFEMQWAQGGDVGETAALCTRHDWCHVQLVERAAVLRIM